MNISNTKKKYKCKKSNTNIRYHLYSKRSNNANLKCKNFHIKNHKKDNKKKVKNYLN